MRNPGWLAIAAVALFAGCETRTFGPLSFDLGLDQTGLTPRTQEFPVSVEFGCRDDDAEISGYDVDYTSTDVTVTFTGSVSYEAGDCDHRQGRRVELEEPLGARRLCDGSTDPPTLVWPRPLGIPENAPINRRCR